MCELVKIVKNDIFTNSMVIAIGTNYEHHSITRKIRDFKKDFEELGKVGYHNQALDSGQKQKIYLLNEPQATYLVTLLENNMVVRKFKLELVKQFYQMRQYILEHQSQHWKNTRLESKSSRRMETDEIKLFIQYAKENGSKNADRYYCNLSKLANKATGIDSDSRELATASQLNNLILIEHIIAEMIKSGIEQEIYYKDIYISCKQRIEKFKEIAFFSLAG